MTCDRKYPVGLVKTGDESRGDIDWSLDYVAYGHGKADFGNCGICGRGKSSEGYNITFLDACRIDDGAADGGC